MGLFDFLTGKRKAAPARVPASDTATSAEELRKEIAKHGLNASKIDIQANGGNVTLGGAATTAADIEKIILAVRNVKGVAHVENKLVALRAQANSRFYSSSLETPFGRLRRGNTATGKERNTRRFSKQTSHY